MKFSFLSLLLAMVIGAVAVPASGGTLYLVHNGAVMGHLPNGKIDPNPASMQVRIATLKVHWNPKKGVSENRAWRMVHDTIAGEFYSGLEDTICSPGLEAAQEQRRWVLETLKEQKVPVTNVTVIYSCRPD